MEWTSCLKLPYWKINTYGISKNIDEHNRGKIPETSITMENIPMDGLDTMWEKNKGKMQGPEARDDIGPVPNLDADQSQEIMQRQQWYLKV